MTDYVEMSIGEGEPIDGENILDTGYSGPSVGNPECILPELSYDVLRDAHYSRGAVGLVGALGSENHGCVMEALGLHEICSYKGDNPRKVAARFVLALDACIAGVVRHGVRDGRRLPITKRDVLNKFETIGELGMLEGAEDQSGHRRRFKMFKFQNVEEYMVTVDGQPLVDKKTTCVDDYGNLVTVKNEAEVSLNEAVLLLNEYLVVLGDTLSAFDDSLSFKEVRGGYEMFVDEGVVAQLEKLYGQYQALGFVFKKHPVLYMLAHLLRSPLYCLMGYAGMLMGEEKTEEGSFIIGEDDRKEIEVRRSLLARSMGVVDKLIDDGDLSIRPISLNDSFSDLMACFDGEFSGRLKIDDIEGDPKVMATPQMLIFVLQNFAMNAIRMGYNVRLETIIRDGCLEMRVHDDGPQIERSTEDILFTPKTRRTGGSGTSLPFTNRMIQDLVGLSDVYPEFKHFEVGFSQSSSARDYKDGKVFKYFFLRLPLASDKAGVQMQRPKIDSVPPLAYAA